MIFVYLGHWSTVHAGAFAYAFHLQLFFLVAGFFATNSIQRDINTWIKKLFFSLFLPYILWVLISFLFINIDNINVNRNDFKTILTAPSSMQPNYWFFPAFIAVVLVYFLLLKMIHRPEIIFLISLVLHFLLGETPIISTTWMDVSLWPSIMQVVNNWIAFSAIPEFLFWYAMGAVVFGYVKKFVNMKEEKNPFFYMIGGFSGLVSFILFFKNLTDFAFIQNIIYSNNFTFELYMVMCSLIIITFIFFISKLLEESKVMNDIGKNSMSFMGLEYITHGYFALSFLPMINLGIPNITSTIHVITIIIIQVEINLFISRKINKYFPILNGK